MRAELSSDLATLATVATGVAAVLAFMLSAFSVVSQAKQSKQFALANAKQQWLNQFRDSVSQLVPLAHQASVKRDASDSSLRELFAHLLKLELLLVGIEGSDEFDERCHDLAKTVGLYHSATSGHDEILRDIGECEDRITEVSIAIIKREQAAVDRLVQGNQK
ncbi:hypothetical protein [Hyphomonas sp.]|uniref:hypothetical protein n=1 Tax=Hyphomonas sp. TaxID=87 RepID=UPI003529C974